VFGVCFVLLGAVGFVPAVVGRGWEGRALGVGFAVAQLSPGVLYAIAAHQIARRTPPAPAWAASPPECKSRGGGVDVALIAGAGRIPGAQFLLIPAVISIFFNPALIAFLFSMNKAIRIARQLDPTGHGFQVLRRRCCHRVGRGDKTSAVTSSKPSNFIPASVRRRPASSPRWGGPTWRSQSALSALAGGERRDRRRFPFRSRS